MAIINVSDIQSDPLGYLRRVENGETLIVVRGDHPVAEISPILSTNGKPRPFGLCAGRFVVPDDFDKPLSEDVLKEFEGP